MLLAVKESRTYWSLAPDGSGIVTVLPVEGLKVRKRRWGLIVDMRGSGSSHRIGAIGRVNQVLRQTPFNELRESHWTVDDQVKYDIPAILDYVQKETGSARVNWVGPKLSSLIRLTAARPGPPMTVMPS